MLQNGVCSRVRTAKNTQILVSQEILTKTKNIIHLVCQEFLRNRLLSTNKLKIIHAGEHAWIKLQEKSEGILKNRLKRAAFRKPSIYVDGARLILQLEGIGEFKSDVTLIVSRKGRDLPFQPGVSPFIKDNIEVGSFFGIVPESNIWKDLVDGTIILYKCW